MTVILLSYLETLRSFCDNKGTLLEWFNGPQEVIKGPTRSTSERLGNSTTTAAVHRIETAR